MSNVKQEFSHKVEYDVYNYTTTDGKVFTDKHNAEDHQLYLDGRKKVCDNCNGSKGEKWWGEDGRLPERWIPCKKCGGKGFLELKFA
jgi:hypothetical protein